MPANADVNLGILIGATDQNATKSLDRVTGAVNELDRSAQKAGSGGLARFASVLKTGVVAGATAALASVAALGAGIVKTTLDAADFEQSIADIGAVMGLARDETGGLKKLILDLGIDPKLKVSATDAAGAVEMLARNGLALDEIMGGAARNTILLANSTGADFKQAADIATDAMAIFNIEASDMQKAIDEITGVTTTSKFGINDYALALGTGAKGAAAAEISFEQFNRMLTATASNFTSGMTAGTSLTAMMLGLAPRTDKAADLMRTLGIITEDGQNRFFDLNGQMRDNAAIAEVMRSTLGKLAPEQRLSAVNTIFGRDAMAAINGMIATTTDQWGEYGKAISTTDAEDSAAKRMDTLRGSMEILSGIIGTLRIQIGDKFVPIFRLMVDRIGEFLSNNAPMLIAWAEQLAGNLEHLVQNWLPGVVRQLREWWNTTSGLIAFAREFGVLAQVLGLLGDAYLNIIAMQLEWAKLMIAHVVNKLPEWSAALARWGMLLWQWIVDATPGALAALGEWTRGLGVWLAQKLPGFLATFLEYETGIWRWIEKSLPAAIDALGDWISGLLVWNDTEGQPGIQSMAKKWGTLLWRWIADDVIPVMGPELLKLGAVMLSALSKIVLSIAAAAAKIGAALVFAIAEALLDLVGISANLDGIRRVLFDTLDSWKTQIFEQGAAVVERIGAGMRNALQDPITAIGNIINAISNTFSTWLGSDSSGALSVFRKGGQALVTGVREGLSLLKDDPSGVVAAMLSKIQDIFTGALDGSEGILAKFLAGGKSLVANLHAGIAFLSADASGHPAKNLGELLINLDSHFTTWLQSGGTGATLLREGGKTLIQAIGAGMAAITSFDPDGPIASLLSQLRGIPAAFTDWLGSASQGNLAAFVEGGKTMMRGLAQGLRDIVGEWSSGHPIDVPLSSILSHVVSWPGMNFSAVRDAGKAFGKAIVDAIGAAIIAGSQTLKDALAFLVNLLPQWAKDILGIGQAAGATVGASSLSGLTDMATSLSRTANGALPGGASITNQSTSTINNNGSTVLNQFSLPSAGPLERDMLEQVRQLNMLYAVS